MGHIDAHKNGAKYAVNEHGAYISGKNGTIITLPAIDSFPLSKIPSSFVNGTRQRIVDIITKKHRCIYNPFFDKRGGYRNFFSLDIDIKRNDLAWYNYFAKINSHTQHEVVLLNKDEEREMFLRFNYARYLKYLRVVHARNTNKRCINKDICSSILMLDSIVNRFRDMITLSNIGLIQTMMKKTGFINRLDSDDYFGQCVVGLTNAINCFDVERGFKFSTYACRSLQKELFRKCQQDKKKNFAYSFSVDDGVGGGFCPDMEQTHKNMLYEDIIKGIESGAFGLTDEQKFILKKRFVEEVTLVETAVHYQKEFGGKLLSKERIRQLQKEVLEQIREKMGIAEQAA